MDIDLPSEFDLIVLGTGFSESCIAAAASRIGKSVLHIDLNEFYGGCWTSFNLESFQEFLESRKDKKKCDIKNVFYQWHVPLENKEKIYDESIENNEDVIDINWSQAKVVNQSRRFNIDLSPKILFSAGRLVELLISSNICRYAEFRAVDKLCTNYQNEIVNVPCSRTDIFNTKDLSVVEKRLLMKLLTNCLNWDIKDNSETFAEYSGKYFIDYLKANHLTEKIIHCVLHAIAMCSESTIFEEGMEKTKQFLLSSGRYGNTPFLFPMYGCGELPQCFCRLCAVFGGTYCLNKKIDKIEFLDKENNFTIKVEGKIISTKHIVLSQEVFLFIDLGTVYVSNLNQLGSKLSRGIFITSSPIGNHDINSNGGGVNLLPLIVDNRYAYVIQLSHYSGTCPKDLYLIHITTEAISDDPKHDISPFYKKVFSETQGYQSILFSAYYTISPNMKEQSEKESGIYCSAGPFFELDYDRTIQNAKNIFSKLYPDAEFLPRAPDPEEIIIGDEDPIEPSEDLQKDREELKKAVVEIEMSKNNESN